MSRPTNLLACGWLAGLLGAVALPVGVQAQTAPDPGPFEPWALQCVEAASEVTDCWLFQRLVNAEDQSLLADIRIEYISNGETTRPVLFMHTPTGILLTQRPAYRVDDDTEDLPLVWHNCTEARCTAIRPLESDELDRLRRGERMAIGYQQWQAPQATVFEVSLTGVTAGLEALAARLEAQ